MVEECDVTNIQLFKCMFLSVSQQTSAAPSRVSVGRACSNCGTFALLLVRIHAESQWGLRGAHEKVKHFAREKHWLEKYELIFTLWACRLSVGSWWKRLFQMLIVRLPLWHWRPSYSLPVFYLLLQSLDLREDVRVKLWFSPHHLCNFYTTVIFEARTRRICRLEKCTKSLPETFAPFWLFSPTKSTIIDLPCTSAPCASSSIFSASASVLNSM